MDSGPAPNGASRDDEGEVGRKKKPAVISGGRPGFGMQEVLRPLRTQRLPDFG
jgi:hypothetical protein